MASVIVTVYDDDNNIVFTSTTREPWAPSTINSSMEYYYKVQATTNKGNHIGQCGNIYLLTCYPACLNKGSLYFADVTDPITDCH